MAQQVNDGWYDPYPQKTWTDPRSHKVESEALVNATHVTYGKGYRIALPPAGQEGFVKIYCIGPVEVEGKGENAITRPAKIQEPEKQVTDTPLTSISHAQDIDVQDFVTESPCDSTCQQNITPEKQTFVTLGRPKSELPVDKIMELHRAGHGSRNIVMLLKLKVSYRTVARVIEGQGLLV